LERQLIDWGLWVVVPRKMVLPLVRS
jgi:hypothetical protein